MHLNTMKTQALDWAKKQAIQAGSALTILNRRAAEAVAGQVRILADSRRTYTLGVTWKPPHTIFPNRELRSVDDLYTVVHELGRRAGGYFEEGPAALDAARNLLDLFIELWGTVTGEQRPLLKKRVEADVYTKHGINDELMELLRRVGDKPEGHPDDFDPLDLARRLSKHLWQGSPKIGGGFVKSLAELLDVFIRLHLPAEIFEAHRKSICDRLEPWALEFLEVTLRAQARGEMDDARHHLARCHEEGWSQLCRRIHESDMDRAFARLKAGYANTLSPYRFEERWGLEPSLAVYLVLGDIKRDVGVIQFTLPESNYNLGLDQVEVDIRMYEFTEALRWFPRHLHAVLPSYVGKQGALRVLQEYMRFARGSGAGLGRTYVPAPEPAGLARILRNAVSMVQNPRVVSLAAAGVGVAVLISILT